MQEFLTALTGTWQKGQKSLYTPWLDIKEHHSDCPLAWQTILNDNALQLSYSWHHEGRDHRGELWLVYDEKEGDYSAAWLDSWHQHRFAMHLKGSLQAGTIDLQGTFPAGPGEPDWGWRICVLPVQDDTCQLEMYVQPPAGQGEETIAVRMQAHR